jgi:non-specific serine/threonine protein kinase
MYAWISTVYMGKAYEMRPYIEKLFQIDPFTLGNSLLTGVASWMRGDIEGAITTLEKAMKTDPGFRWGNFWLANILARNQKYERLKNVVDSVCEADATDIVAEWLMFFWHACQHNKEKALEVLTDTVRKFTWNDPEGVWIMAGLFSMIDEKNQALDWLEHAVKRGWINFPLFAKNDPFLENIRGEPRFKKLMERVKHEWENFEV